MLENVTLFHKQKNNKCYSNFMNGGENLSFRKISSSWVLLYLGLG